MKLLENLCLAVSPSNHEEAAIKIWDDFCKSIPGSSHSYSDHLGNSVWSLGNGPKKILFSAHIDTVYAMVTKITDKGTLMFSQGAGICLKSLISGNVLVCTDSGFIPGVIQKIALHIDDDRKRIGDFLDYRVNIGCSKRSEVENLGIYPGCQIIYRPEIHTKFGPSNFICGTGLDDKAGIWIVAESMKNLAGKIPAGYTVYFGACTQEETGLNGAKRVAKNINPDISIDIDCTFADTELAGNEFKDLDTNLGDGALIAYGPEKSRRLCEIMKNTASLHQIPFKTYATRAGGTNTKSFQDFAIDCECGLLSYGLLSMHSSNEIVEENDLRSCVKLIEKIITNKNL